MTVMHRVGFLLLGSVLIFAIFGPVVAELGYDDQDLARVAEPPSLDYWLGTDYLGRSMAVRLAEGGRHSLVIAGLSVLVAVVLGSMMGIMGGTIPLARPFVRWSVDAFQLVPDFLIVFLIASSLEGRPWSLAIAITCVGWVEACRVSLATSEVMSRGPAVEAARLVALPNLQIIGKLVLPAVIPPVAAVACMGVGHAILSISVLGFLGVGLEPPQPEWGAMISASLPYMRDAPHLVVLPTLLIALSVGGLLMLAGEWRRTA